MRLLAKAPEERYQNGFGVMADIRECIKQFEEKQKIEAFELGRHDISNRFIIPQKLFGTGKRDRGIDIEFRCCRDPGKGSRGHGCRGGSGDRQIGDGKRDI